FGACRARAGALRRDRCDARSRGGRRCCLGDRQRAASPGRGPAGDRGRRVVSPARRTQDEEAEAPHPRESSAWFGHAAAERALLEAYRAGRIPHGWLIGGPPGIGKATLAYRMARFVLAHPDASAPAVQAAATLAVDPNHPASRRIAARAHGGLLVL